MERFRIDSTYNINSKIYVDSYFDLFKEKTLKQLFWEKPGPKFILHRVLEQLWSYFSTLKFLWLKEILTMKLSQRYLIFCPSRHQLVLYPMPATTNIYICDIRRHFIMLSLLKRGRSKQGVSLVTLYFLSTDLHGGK